MSELRIIERRHQAYASSAGDYYQAACHDCEWRGTLFAGSAAGKVEARAEGSTHEMAMGLVYEVPEQLLTADPRLAAAARRGEEE
jgi:hypothetical protein